MNKEERIDWHQGFISALRLEFQAYQDDLEFYAEVNLNTKPLCIDAVNEPSRPEGRGIDCCLKYYNNSDPFYLSVCILFPFPGMLRNLILLLHFHIYLPCTKYPSLQNSLLHNCFFTSGCPSNTFLSMIPFCSYFKKFYLISFIYFSTSFFYCFTYHFTYYYSPILCRTYL
ncbi:hypothetical protein Holit_00069 [Hollandina sp. SP2]